MAATDEERDNFFRMVLLLFRLGNLKLREFFKYRWLIVQNKTGTPPPSPWTDIPNDATEMRKQESKPLKFKFNDQEQSFDSGDTNKWDFSLLTTVLNTSTLGFVTSSSPEGHAIKELKQIRNDLICHAPDAKIPNSVYKTEWPKACAALTTVFNATQAEIDQVLIDVQKPVDVLMPILKECLTLEKEILNAIYELEKSNEIRHCETIAALKEGTEEIKEFVHKGLNEVKDVIKEHAETGKSMEDQKLQEFVNKRLEYIQKHVIASELFDFLRCLPDDIREAVEHLERTSQPIRAVKELILGILEKKGDAGFQMLVIAFSKAGYDHVALLLDPDFEDHVSDEDVAKNLPEENYMVIAGTAIDIFLTLRFMDEQNQRLLTLEQAISVQFSQQQMSTTKKLRSNFTKILPKGVCFVETKNLGEIQGSNKAASENGATSDSVVVVLRLAKAKALEELWKNLGNLKEEFKRLLVKNVLLGEKDVNNLQNCTVEMVFEESDYASAKETLNDFENQNDSGAASAAIPSKKHFICQEIPPVYLADETNNESHEIVLREYQKELAAPALEGNNTIICAPTNSGKTFVAVEIAKRHLDAPRDTERKVIFVVEKQNLILQQRLRFQKFLRQYRIADICSYNSHKASLEQLLRYNHVIVLTADILVNALEQGRVKITDLSLLLFDECHHNNKSHPFRNVMKFYLIEKVQEKERPRLPQVVGLTASLGIGQSNTLDGAINHIFQMCANHDALTLQTVRQEVDDLKRFIAASVPQSIVNRIENDFPNIFEKKVNEAMGKIEDAIGVCSPSSQRHLEGYRQWIEIQEDNFQIDGNRENVVYTKHLRRYHEALLLNYSTPIDEAMTFLRTECSEDANFTTETQWLKELSIEIETAVSEYIGQFGKPSNPLIEVLKESIFEFHDKSSKAKGIVFTRTRQNTIALTKCIKEASTFKNILLKPEVLVGSGDVEVGLSLPQQRAVIERFKTGNANIIVATSAAHEGLDIADCNYAISYDMLDSEISLVQSRGRIREKDGIYVRIVGSRSRSAENEQKLKRNEKMMQDALLQVQDLGTAEISTRVNSLQKEYVKSLIDEKEQQSAKLKAAHGIKFYCGECNEFAFLVEDLLCYKNNHLVVNTGIFDRIVIKERENKKDKERFKFKVHCRKCNKEWGVVLMIKETQWPCVKMDSFIVLLEDGRREKFKKWSKAPFKISEASLGDLHNARQALT